MQDSKIGWTHHTINFWWGCEKVSPACQFCYAKTQAALRGFTVNGRAGTSIWGRHQPRKWGKHALKEARRLNDSAGKRGVRERVFINSMSDFFETDYGQPIIDHLGRRVWVAPGGSYVFTDRCDSTAKRMEAAGAKPLTLNDLRRQAFELCDECRNLDFILLTKRPENIREMWPSECSTPTSVRPVRYRENVWLMTTVENQAMANERIPHLLECRDLVPVLGLSCEPLLGPLTFRWAKWKGFSRAETTDELDGLRMLDWVITGCEQQSPRNRREMQLDWVRSIDEQCQAAGVPHFFKQYYNDAGQLQTDGLLDDVVRQEFPQALTV